MQEKHGQNGFRRCLHGSKTQTIARKSITLHRRSCNPQHPKIDSSCPAAVESRFLQNMYTEWLRRDRTERIPDLLHNDCRRRHTPLPGRRILRRKGRHKRRHCRRCICPCRSIAPRSWVSRKSHAPGIRSCRPVSRNSCKEPGRRCLRLPHEL